MSTPNSPVVATPQPVQASGKTPAPAAVTPPIHQAWYAKAATWLLGVGKSVKAGLLKVAGATAKIAVAVEAAAPTIEAVSNMIVPGSGIIEAHIIDVWSHAASAVKAAGDAADANGVSLTLDAALVAEIKAILPAVEAFLHPQAGPAAPTS